MSIDPSREGDSLRSLGWTSGGDGLLQQPADIAVVMPTVLRPELLLALRSVFAQKFAGRVQVLIGVDRARGDRAVVHQALGVRPEHVSVLMLELPWSTSKRHGGVHLPGDGGSLRAILSYMANAHYVTYLDDDNIWLPDHLTRLHAAVQGKTWAFAHRMLVDGSTGRDLVVDRWDSVGPDQGRMASIGGFADTNCLMVDKVRAAGLFGLWADGLNADVENKQITMTADRNFFRALRTKPFARVEQATVRYFLRPNNILWRLMKEAEPATQGSQGALNPDNAPNSRKSSEKTDAR